MTVFILWPGPFYRWVRNKWRPAAAGGIRTVASVPLLGDRDDEDIFAKHFTQI